MLGQKRMTVEDMKYQINLADISQTMKNTQQMQSVCVGCCWFYHPSLYVSCSSSALCQLMLGREKKEGNKNIREVSAAINLPLFARVFVLRKQNSTIVFLTQGHKKQHTHTDLVKIKINKIIVFCQKIRTRCFMSRNQDSARAATSASPADHIRSLSVRFQYPPILFYTCTFV